MRILRRGTRGDDVRQWQEFLNGQGLSAGTADGVFGNNTFQATVEFQRRNSLTADGVVGAATLGRARELGFVEATPPPPPPPPDVTGDGPLTAQALRQIMPGAKPDRLAAFFPFLISAMQEFEINTPLRQAAFIAQLAHESGQFRFMEEIWGPTSAQRRYEGRRDLGNTQPGDGFRYKGRGPIQITGRFNYRKYGAALGIDLENNPTLAATPEVGFRIAGVYWTNNPRPENNCNILADQGKFITITKTINGGTNGLADRQQFYERAKRVLGVGGTRAIGEAVEGEDSSRALAEPVERSFTRGLDEPGETTPTAAERNASEGAAKAPARTPASGKAAGKAGAKKSAAKKAAAKKTAAKKSGAAKGAGKAAAKKAAGKKSAAKPAAKKAAKTTAKGSGRKGGRAGAGGAKKGGAQSSKKSAARPAKRGGTKSAKGGSRGR